MAEREFTRANGGTLTRTMKPHSCNPPSISAYVLSVGDQFTCDCGVSWEVYRTSGGAQWDPEPSVLAWQKVPQIRDGNLR